jgi:hypothetical protein
MAGEQKILDLNAAVVILALFGYGPGAATKTGYLFDYSRLRTHLGSSLRYVNERALGKYSSFIFDTVNLHFHSIVLPIQFSRLLAGKTLYDNKLHSSSREFYTLKGMD